ncbi:MAG TPA: bifunctional sulfate adenylyltransferase/adenylylsulfate kinase [Egibacteraceae bacterium]|nr:bifunctional sulfate adenylyltransferase/adenylylsulfate kinase [Egibacteraceae bacterium]
MASLIAPHGGELVDLVVDAARAAELKEASRTWASWDLTERQLCDLELLANGAFSPLRGFLSRADYEAVRDGMRLADGTLWPMPITLDVTEAFAEGLSAGDQVALRDAEGVMLAVLHVEDVWRPDLEEEARKVFGTADTRHPAVAHLLQRSNPVYVGGRVEALQLPQHYDFHELRRTPAQVRELIARHGWERVVAFQTRNPMHRAHVEITRRAAEEVGGGLLIHPVVGLTKPGDVDHYTRVRVYRKLIDRYPDGSAELSLLNLAMRMGGPREAVWHAIIRRNHGVTHFIVGRDHAGPGNDSAGEPFYGPYDAQELMATYAEELGVGMVPFRMMVYIAEQDRYVPDDEVPEGSTVLSISGTQQRELLARGEDIPEWFTYPEVVEELRRTSPPREKQGFTVFFTGLSGSGKSTVANVLMVKLLERGGRNVTMLDGDLVRKHLSSGLGFSKEDRDTNIRRIGWVAAEIAKNGGVAVCAPIAPYDATRKAVREMTEAQGGGFALVHVATPLEVCEQRDRKGLYAKARAGELKEFTGISDPYEEPDDAELVINTAVVSAEQAADEVLAWFEKQGYFG